MKLKHAFWSAVVLTTMMLFGCGGGDSPAGATPEPSAPLGTNPSDSTPAGSTPAGTNPTTSTPTDNSPTTSNPSSGSPTASTPDSGSTTSSTPTSTSPTTSLPPAGSPTSSTPPGTTPAVAVFLRGTAAVGYPIVGGTVRTTCAAGTAITNTQPTSTTGSFAVDVSGQTFPCAVQVAGGSINNTANTTAYQSIATSLGNVNVTPFTDLLVANLAGVAAPQTWFTGLTPAQLSAVTAPTVATALSNLRSALNLTALNTIDPITLPFDARPGVVMDDALAALRAAMGASTSYASLLSAAGAAAGAAFTPPTGVASALTSFYGATQSGATATGSQLSITSINTFGGPLATGQTLYIFGQNFGALNDSMTVSFAGGATVNTTLAGITNYVTVIIPIGAQTGLFTVTNNRTGASAVSSFPVNLPAIASQCISYSGVSTPLPATGVAATNWSDCSGQAPQRSTLKFINNEFFAFGGATQMSVDGYRWTDIGVAVRDAAYNGQRYVGIKTDTSNLQIWNSAGNTPTAWTVKSVTLSSPGLFTSISAANGRFFIATNNGSFLTSADGINWVETAGATCGGTTSSPLYIGSGQPVAWNGSKYLINVQPTSFSPEVTCSSADGVAWGVDPVTVPLGRATDGTKYVESRSTGIWTSVDGTLWLQSPIAAPQMQRIFWTGTQFVGVASSVSFGPVNIGLHFSPDGINWTPAAMRLPLPAGLDVHGNSIAYSSALNRLVFTGGFTPTGSSTFLNPFVSAYYVLHQLPAPGAIGTLPAPTGLSGSAAVTGRGINLSWVAVNGAVGYDVFRSTTPGQPLGAMTKIASAQTALAFADTGLTGATTYYYRVTALIDAARASPPSAEISASTSTAWRAIVNAVGATNFRGVTWSGTQFVAYGNSGKVYTSVDSAVWTLRGHCTANQIFNMIWTGTQFVSVDQLGGICTSPDALTWTAALAPTTTAQGLTGVAWTGTKYVAVGGVIRTSTDGTTWPISSTGTNLSGVAWSGTQFVAVGAAGTVMTSPDGVTWTPRTSGTASNLAAITWAGTQFVAVGAAGTLLTSPDGVTWTARTSGTTNALGGLTWTGTQIVVVGGSGLVLTSTDGVSWLASSAGTTVTQGLTGVAWSGARYVAVGANNGIATAP